MNEQNFANEQQQHFFNDMKEMHVRFAHSQKMNIERMEAEEQARKDNMVMTAVSRAVVIGVTIAVASVIYNKYFK